MKKIIIILPVLLLLVLTAFFLYRPMKSEVKINNKTFKVEIANSPSEKEKGLSGRDALEIDRGMLFVFSKAKKTSFWMKNTLIPLDIIFIRDNKIVEMTTLDAESEDYIPQYDPKEAADNVLEINAGLAESYGFKIGDNVIIR